MMLMHILNTCVHIHILHTYVHIHFKLHSTFFYIQHFYIGCLIIIPLLVNVEQVKLTMNKKVLYRFINFLINNELLVNEDLRIDLIRYVWEEKNFFEKNQFFSFGVNIVKNYER